MVDKTAPELIAEFSKEPTLDVLLNRNPHSQPYSDAELLRLIQHQRAERAQFLIKEQKKKDKKEGVEDVQLPETADE